jgi:glycosyltransferase involved in cell wall biosynthesis
MSQSTVTVESAAHELNELKPIQACSRSPKVVHLSTYDIAGGAARAAYRLHAGLRKAGVDSSMFVREARTTDGSVIRFEPATTFCKRAERRIRREHIERKLRPAIPPASEKMEPFRTDRSEFGPDILSKLPPYDILNLHWIADFVDYPSFFGAFSKNTRIVWTLHDMNAFTGGCHYDLGCGRYLDQCGDCPQLVAAGPNDLSREIWTRKKMLFDQLSEEQIHFATPSGWLAEEVKRSPILGRFPVSVIPYGLDLEEFSPRDAGSAREVFGIPREAKVILFVADGLPLFRKGFEVLVQALEQLRRWMPDLHLVTVGHHNPTFGHQVPHSYLGHINSDRLLSNIYSAADLLVIPSLQDNLPNTVLEAMACGTPAVGFDVGGIPDMIQHRRTGLLVSRREPGPLSAAMLELLQNPDHRRALGANSRRHALSHFSLEEQADRYCRLYTEILRDRVLH